MLESVTPNLKFTQLFLFIAFVIVYKYRSDKKMIDQVLLYILAISLSVEIMALILMANHSDYIYLYNLNAIIHNTFWLYLLLIVLNKNRFIHLIVGMNILFGIVNFLFIEGLHYFNHYTFIVSALTYLSILFFESLNGLKKEKFFILQSNDYLLLLSPIIFFLGLSFIFSFNKSISKVLIIGRYTLYDSINVFVNFIYYSFIILYIYREKKRYA